MKILLRRGWPALALLALTLLFFYPLAFSGLILARGDTYTYFYPYWAARNAALLQGHLPLWSPDLFMGVPLLANPQLGTFYPPNWPLIVLSPPDGIRLSVLLHVFWGLLGAYALARRWLDAALPALAAAVIYGLGGHVGAHVEQINQLQGLAWLPWLFWLYDQALARPVRWTPLLAAGLALLFLAGHTQTIFIAGVGLALFGLIQALTGASRGRGLLRAGGILAGAGALLLLLALPQLAPTLELTGVSNRSGGLNPNEATSFSFHPLIFGRGLLPSYDSIVFGEFVTYTGVIGLGLALIGLWIPRRGPLAGGRLLWGLMALAGLLLALGEFNPLYWQLAQLPGFNYFRVPARWLALFTLGAALLAGFGLRYLQTQRPRGLVVGAAAGVIVVLALISPLAAQAPQDVIGPAAPTAITWVGWGLALAVLLTALALTSRIGTRRSAALLALALLVELFLAARVLPYNLLVLPEAYSAQRFTISQLRAYHAEQTPPGRLLSISDGLFDPGDRAALEARYARYGLGEHAVQISHIATKQKEIVAPNLPLVWGLPSIDGFDGGLLPTRYYTAFSTLLLPPESLATFDGRLREILADERCRGMCLPDRRWLNLTGTRYLITDKIFDLWHEGVAFDTALTVPLAPGESASVDNPTAFMADSVQVLTSGSPTLQITWAADSGETLSLTPAGSDPILLDGLTLGVWQADVPAAPVSVNIRAEGIGTLHAVTLVDSRTGDFAQLVPDATWARRLSSDIKLYENQAVQPRAFIVTDTRTVPDSDAGTAAALDILRDPAFDPTRTAVIHHDAPAETLAGDDHTAVVTLYTPERIAIRARSASGGYLILTDSYYPGWQASVNGADTPIYRANIQFRAVRIPAGDSEVLLTYRPAWLPGAPIAGLLAWLGLAVGTMALWRYTGRR